jgi:hypothetical protein
MELLRGVTSLPERKDFDMLLLTPNITLQQHLLLKRPNI